MARWVPPVRFAVVALVALAIAADASLVRLDPMAGGLVRPARGDVQGAIQAAPPVLRASTGQPAPAATAVPAVGNGTTAAGTGIPAEQLAYPAWVDYDAALEAYLAAYPTPTPTPLPTPDLTPSPRLAARGSAPLVSSGSRDRPVIALTIDDTYRAACLRADHEFFMEQRVSVTWFPIGRTIAGNASLWREIADAGFPIADHTWNHVDATKQTEPQIEAEIRSQAAAVLQHTGRPGAPFFRPMGGSWNGNVLRAAGMTGMASVVLWDTTSGDTGRGTADDVIANALRARNGSIILFHANDERSDIAIRQVVFALRARGYAFVTLGQLLGVRGPIPFPDPPAPDPAATPRPTPPPPPPFIPVPPAAPVASSSPGG